MQTAQSSVSAMALSEWPVPLFVPNLIGYLRLLLIIYALHFAHTDAPVFVRIWTISCALDFFDGLAARRLGQCSRLGELLDLVCDNVSRAAMWIAWCSVNPPGLPLALGVVSLEWLTCLATQLSSAMRDSGHWKHVEARPVPSFCAAFFANNFVNPLGMWGIAGLFGAPLFLFVSKAWPAALQYLYPVPPYAIGFTLLSGRAFCAIIELYFIGDCSRLLIGPKPKSK